MRSFFGSKRKSQAPATDSKKYKAKLKAKAKKQQKPTDSAGEQIKMMQNSTVGSKDSELMRMMSGSGSNYPSKQNHATSKNASEIKHANKDLQAQKNKLPTSNDENLFSSNSIYSIGRPMMSFLLNNNIASKAIELGFEKLFNINDPYKNTLDNLKMAAIESIVNPFKGFWPSIAEELPKDVHPALDFVKLAYSDSSAASDLALSHHYESMPNLLNNPTPHQLDENEAERLNKLETVSNFNNFT